MRAGASSGRCGVGRCGGEHTLGHWARKAEREQAARATGGSGDRHRGSPARVLRAQGNETVNARQVGENAVGISELNVPARVRRVISEQGAEHSSNALEELGEGCNRTGSNDIDQDFAGLGPARRLRHDPQASGERIAAIVTRLRHRPMA